jgi:16S rRNA G966 N2-methylase RsmD
VEILLAAYASPGETVLDPFAGSGTVLVESARRQLPAIGAELNPSAYTMARTYRFVNRERERRWAALRNVERLLEERCGPALPLLAENGRELSPETIKSSLVALARRLSCVDHLVLVEALVVLVDFYRSDLRLSRLWETWHRLKATTANLPYSGMPLEVYNSDARSLPLDSRIVDLVITSPPYINVFNYHQQFRSSTEALGWDLLDVARSEIGSNRKHRANRFLTVVQYCLDISQALSELRRVCTDEARSVVIIGRESTVRKTPFRNGEIVANLVERSVGWRLEGRQQRCFVNRFGLRIWEDILHLRAGAFEARADRMAAGNAPALAVADTVLRAALERAPQECQTDLRQALEALPSVYPSPLYDYARPARREAGAVAGPSTRSP